MSRTGSLGLDVEILRRLNRDRLVRVLEDAPGSKDLVIDGDLLKMLDRIAGATLLRSHGVEKMHKLQRVPPPVQCGQRVYIVRPALVTLKYIADHVHEDARTHPDLRVHVVVVPRLTPSVTGLLEEEGLYGTLNLHEFTPEFVPLDDDLLSLEMTSFFRDAFLGGDYSGCVGVARALNTLQGLFGAFPNAVAHGRAARAVVGALDALTAQESPKKGLQLPEIGHLFVFDRDADLVTPLLSQLTYEGALDEHFGIRAGVVELPKEVAGPDAPTKLPLNARDTIYDNIRNRHFAGVSGYLITRAHEVKAKREQAQTMTTAQMKDFVANEIQTLQQLQRSLSLHLSACEAITTRTRKDFDSQLSIEHGLVTGAGTATEAQTFLKDCLARMLPLHANLRLLCLLSLTQDGLSRDRYNMLSQRLLAAHGHRHLVTLQHLRQIGLLAVNDSFTSGGSGGGTGGANGSGGSGGSGSGGVAPLQDRLAQVASLLPRRGSGWRAAAKRLRLIPDAERSIDLHNPTDMSYVFNGAYTPAVPKVVGDVLSGRLSPSQLQDALKVLPGTTVVRTAAPGGPPPPRVALVVLLGGITFAEVAAFRLLALTSSTRIVLAATATATGTDLVGAAVV
ncbi:vacuolar protein sorting-associated protein 33B-like [Penaeus chinensis]|uniref:vacuolar protein sorting-associated protein 33B-like n=1 Tax=Penaeus chinensis TaxID=139456 RepID=UPI001FB695EF|nr:vacuolar protein sorting-associated protein 33B-like [Penaeus chinensis]XP_047498363.1 vacuolar protein sorting-associated protein 33B-like [Penaeus chinensis]XP_047498364.1 vacuolar protein sorting-associated protein 33B-like [Penaeus chinensis]XP_047498365.1 vacuolar protein sorting-associated protein 33B-like [Penaeus chinensis]XP_047498366.1 vacuolar protein sorting-associated protein 33B-like [Penaeus chinensis]XP_047498367.1 vacuolar protein sorting-associated protein 33B-like [Penaeu